VLNNCLLSSAC